MSSPFLARLKRLGVILSIAAASSASLPSTKLPEAAKGGALPPACGLGHDHFKIDEMGVVSSQVGTAGVVIDRPGCYVVTRDLVVPNVDYGFVILANHVTLDFQNHVVSDAVMHSTIIRIVGSYNVTIVNGNLKGGRAGVTAAIEASSAIGSHITIRSMSITSAFPSYEGISIRGYYDAHIHSNVIAGVHRGIIVRDNTFIVVANNRVEVERSGVELFRSLAGRIHHNIIKASAPLSADSSYVIEDNVLVTSAAGAEALLLRGSINHVVHNQIDAKSANSAITLVGSMNVVRENRIVSGQLKGIDLLSWGNVIENNRLEGGADSSISMSSFGNRLFSNWITAPSVGVGVSGASNLVEQNSFGGGLECGIAFGGADRNAYRYNRMRGFGVEVCGEPNISGTGSGTGSWHGEDGEESSETSRRPGSGFVGYDGKGPGGENRVLISDFKMMDTAFGTTGLMIDEPGYYILTKDLVVPYDENGFRLNSGILVTAADVVIDLNNHLILGAAEILVRAVLEGSVTLRRGLLVGGDIGLHVTSADGKRDQAKLSLENLKILWGGNIVHQGLSIHNVAQVEIRGCVVEGLDVAVGVTGPTTGLIEDSFIDSAELGFHGPGFDQGEIRRSLFYGDLGLWVGSGNTVAENTISGVRDPALMAGRGNVVLRNMIVGAEDAVWILEDQNLIRDNVIRASNGTGVSLISNVNRIEKNVIHEAISGVEVSGEDNIVQNNLFIRPHCGLVFRREQGNIFSENVVLDATEGVCGATAEDGGGNIVPATICGNGLRSIEEVCDGSDIPGQSCEDFGFGEGTLGCNQTCDGFDISFCSTCGDGSREGHEVCDGVDMPAWTCEDFGFSGGVLSCSASCRVDLSKCVK